MKLETRDPEQNPFGYLLYQSRVRRGEKPDKPLPMADAAQFLGVREGTYLQWETGKGRPTFPSGTKLLGKLVAFTGLEYVELLRMLEIMPGE